VQSELQNETRDPAVLIRKKVGNLSFRHPSPFSTSAQKNEEYHFVLPFVVFNAKQYQQTMGKK